MIGILVAALVLLLLASEAIHAAHSGWFGLRLNWEIRPLEAITLAVNLFIAFFLQRYFTTILGDIRAEKSVLIASATELLKLLGEARDLTTGQLRQPSIDPQVASSIVILLRRVANTITDLEASVALSRLKSLAGCFQDIWTDYYALKATTTGGGFPTVGYTVQQLSAQDRLFRQLMSKSRRLVFNINSASR